MAEPELPVWAVAPGVPSPHVARAALQAGAILERHGSSVGDARESYWHRATGGAFPDVDLRRGERLLVDCGLVEERDGVLIPTAQLDDLLEGTVEDALEVIFARVLKLAQPEWLTGESDAAPPRTLEFLVPDPTRREELLIGLGRRFSDERQRLLGEIGEEIVVADARRELENMGHRELARAVRRVSLESDQLGYDVSAPRLSGARRLLEVKATTALQGDSTGVHITRNEASVGRSYPADWALVVCRITNVDAREGEIVGWCSRSSLDDLLPKDPPGGRWEQAWIELPAAAFTPGLPRVVI
ncbi:MAG: DUF3883 domain-containing protein [Actinomycetota bacterium]|nr:DUF3883 domain-containing protein [Actinomycetota bacterium]